MTSVEFRLLQFIISHLTGDRVSVVLLHWDGTELRVASSLEHLVVCEPAQRDVVRTSVNLIVARAKKVARNVAANPRLNHGLQELFPVREGRGAALYWTPVTSAETANPSAHFAQLGATLELDRAREHYARRFSSHALSNQLKALGEELKAVAPRRIKTEHAIKLKKNFQSPVSWKNGRWHHALPFSLDGLDGEQVDREVEHIVGLVELAVPRTDVPVVVALLPEDAELARRTKSEVRIVKETLSARGCEILTVPLQGKSVELGKVRQRVKSDVTTGHGARTPRKSSRARSRGVRAPIK